MDSLRGNNQNEKYDRFFEVGYTCISWNFVLQLTYIDLYVSLFFKFVSIFYSQGCRLMDNLDMSLYTYLLAPLHRIGTYPVLLSVSGVF